MKPMTKDYHTSLLADLRDPEEAAAYLRAALEERDMPTFLLALRNVAEAHGMSALAAKAQLNRESLYRMLSGQGNPQLASVRALLQALDLDLTVTAK
jgi:probable addiction module antidote protein